MTHVDEVADGTYWLETQIPGLPTIFSMYFIKDSHGGVLIDPGPAALMPTIQEAINHLGLSDLKYIIPTHIHMDHGGAVGELIKFFPQAKVVVHPQGVRHIIDPSRLIRSTRMAFGEDFATVYGTILPVPESQVKVVEDGERLFVDSRELVIIYTPGHAPHHIAIFDTKVKGLFCGEALGLIYSANSPPLPATAPPGLDAEVYLSTMERLRQLKPQILFYSHGGVDREPEKAIASVIENTKIVGDAILRAFKSEKTEEAVIRKIGEYIWSRFGARLGEYDLTANVRGYIHYFKKKGLA
jgi:glyoxylase-like metal-dependent hydrolase (beta-lactamase superfamily II)